MSSRGLQGLSPNKPLTSLLTPWGSTVGGRSGEGNLTTRVEAGVAAVDKTGWRGFERISAVEVVLRSDFCSAGRKGAGGRSSCTGSAKMGTETAWRNLLRTSSFGRANVVAVGVLSSLGSDSRHKAGAAGIEMEANDRAERMERSDFCEMGEIGLGACSVVDRTQVWTRSCCASGSTGDV